MIQPEPCVSQSLVERYRLADPTPVAPAAAREFCRRLAHEHYENFTVGSWFLPRALRQHFANLYAYCRISDDLADELSDPAASLELLAHWRTQLHDCFAGRAEHPVFVALGETITQFDLPVEPFDRLLDAFCQDRRQTRYATFDELRGYCANSADPVGHLVLYLGGYRDAERQRLSDCICTGLQLTNFWQDVTRDWHKGRVYFPAEDLARFGVGEEQIAARRFDARFADLMRFEVDRTRDLFRAGLPLLERVDGHLRRDVTLFVAGGWSILDRIERQGYDTLSRRPTLSRAAKAGLMLRVLAGGRPPWA